MVNHRSLLLAHLTLFCAALADNIRGPLLGDLQGAFALDNTQVSWFFSVALLASMPATIYAGRALRVFPDVRCLQGGIVIYVLGLLGIAWAPHYVWVLVAAVLFGLGMGTQHVIVSVMVSRAAPGAVRTRHMTWVQVMYGLASFCAPMLVIAGRQILETWQSFFMVAAILPCMLIIIAPYLNPPGERPESFPPAIRMGVALRDSVCRFYSTLIGFCIMAELAVSFWLVLYVQHLPGVSVDNATWYLSAFFGMMVLSRISGGWLLVGRSNRNVLRFTSVAAIGCIVAGLYVHPIFLSCSAFPMGFFYPVGFASLSCEKEHNLEAAISWVMCGVFVWIAVGQLILGWIGDAMSLHAALHVPIVALCVVLVLLTVRKPRTQ